MAASSLATSLPTGRRGRILAVGLTLAVAGTLWVGVLAPLVAWKAELAEMVERRKALVARMEGLAVSLPVLQGRLAAAEAATPGLTTLPGGTDAVVAAALQQWIETAASRHGTSLASAEVLPAEPLGAYRRIGLRVAVAGAWQPLVRILQDIEEATPKMLVDDVQIQAGLVLGDGMAKTIDAAFTLYGFREPATPVALP